MNFYLLVEGDAEKAVYRQWIPELRAGVNYVDNPAEMQNDDFCIVSGKGYPYYLEMIAAAVDDTQNMENTRLIIAVDSEDLTRAEKFAEIDNVVRAHAHQGLDYRIVVQHFCFEAWALGNRRVGPRNPKADDLKRLKSIFDVMVADPEQLPPIDARNRAQTALLYLRAMLRDRSPKMIYSKSNPQILSTREYLQHLQDRTRDTGHIGSMQSFIDAFI